MKKTIYRTATILCLLLSGFSLSAQVKEFIVVPSVFQPTMSDANKLNTQPMITDTNITVLPLKYTYLTRKYKTSYSAEPIKPARVGDPTLMKLYKFLIKAGWGNYTMPYGEFFVNNTYARNFSIGAHLKHLSASGKLKNWAYPGNSENIVDFYGKKIFKTNVIGGTIAYKRNVYHFYGFKPDDFPIQPLDRDMYKQRFNLINANVYFNSLHHPDSLKINYAIDLKYYYLNDYFTTAENAISLTGDINKDLHLFKFTSSQVLGIHARVDYAFAQDTNVQYNAGIITLKPYLKTTFKGFNFNLGIDISTQVDSNTSMHFYPFADVQFNIVKNILIVFAGIDGKLTHNSFLSQTSENPYINSKIQTSFTSNPYTIYGGIKSSISRSLNFSATVSYASLKNMPLYVNDTNLIYQNRFDIIYDNSKLLNIKAELAYQKDEKFKLLVGGNFYNYKMETEQKAWHKPIFDAYVNFVYNIHDKFIITADITGRSNVYAKTYDGITIKPKTIDGYADVSLGLEYRYSKIVSAFITMNNITSIKYYKWYNYPSYGFNMLGGVTYAF
ncbi:MAG: hypothetical protein WCQ95_13215 [Bacteroidota bacterium]